MKKIFFALLLISFSLGLHAQNKAVVDKVVASVGGEIILLSEVQEQIAYSKQQEPNLPADYDCYIVQNLIVQKLLVNQAKLDSIEVKPEEVENQLDARIDRLLLYFNQDPQAIEEYYGQGIEQIKEQMRNDMQDQMLAERMQGEITSRATVSPSEVKNFFASIDKDSLPYFNSEVEIRELVYKPEVNEVERQKSLDHINELRKRIVEDGEDFAELAKKYSDDPGSGAAGGDLGWQKRGTFVPEFESMIYKLEKNQISPVVETEFGFHIIQMLERRGNLVRGRHILVRPEITQADLDLAKEKLDTVRQMIIRDSSMTFSHAIKRFGFKDVPSYNNDGRVANPRTGNTFFEVADLDTDIFFAIDGLEPGQITEPVSFRANDGSRFYRLVELSSRTKPHVANLQQDYNKIQTAALEQKKAGFTDKWMLEKVGSTYLSIDPRYLTCPNLLELVNQSATARRP
ncbi:MAG: peptidylprolyl isomerase [Saprospiraceae bacterium]